MHTEQGGPEQEFDDVVAVADRIQAVLYDLGKAQVAGQFLDVYREPVACQRRRAEGQHRSPLLDALQAFQVAL